MSEVDTFSSWQNTESRAQPTLESLQKVRVTLAAARIGTVWMDLRSGALVVDAVAAHMLGAESPASLTTLDALKENVVTDDRTALDIQFARAAEGHALDVEVRVKTPNGAPRWIALRGNIEEGSGSSVLSGVSVELRASPDEAGHRAGEALSDRERTVARMIAMGYGNKAIAGDLRLSVKTVETYKRRAFDKLQVSTRAELVRRALRDGWLQAD